MNVISSNYITGRCAVKVELVRIGNSQGVRIPKPVIEQCGFQGVLEMRVEDNALIVSSARKLRDGWERSFVEMAAHADDESGIWDDAEWEW
jgi:antitoxin MazE